MLPAHSFLCSILNNFALFSCFCISLYYQLFVPLLIGKSIHLITLSIHFDSFLLPIKTVNLWIGDERSVSAIHKDHFENMYAVITGAKTFTLLPPTDILYLEKNEYSTMKYQLKKEYHNEKGGEMCPSIDVDIDNSEESLPILNNRVGIHDLELISNKCPSESLNWISTNPDDPDVLRKFPNFKYAHPIRCTVRPGEILYIPGESSWYQISSIRKERERKKENNSI